MANRRDRGVQPDNTNYNANNSYNNFNGQPNGQPNMNNLGQLFNNLDINQVMGQLSQMMGGNGIQGTQPGMQPGAQSGMQAPKPAAPRDPRMQLLYAMKPFLNKKRGGMIDNISQLYSLAQIFRQNFMK